MPPSIPMGGLIRPVLRAFGHLGGRVAVFATQGEDVDLPGGSLITIRLDAPLNFGRR